MILLLGFAIPVFAASYCEDPIEVNLATQDQVFDRRHEANMTKAAGATAKADEAAQEVIILGRPDRPEGNWGCYEFTGLLAYEHIFGEETRVIVGVNHKYHLANAYRYDTRTVYGGEPLDGKMYDVFHPTVDRVRDPVEVDQIHFLLDGTTEGNSMLPARFRVTVVGLTVGDIIEVIIVEPQRARTWDELDHCSGEIGKYGTPPLDCTVKDTYIELERQVFTYVSRPLYIGEEKDKRGRKRFKNK